MRLKLLFLILTIGLSLSLPSFGQEVRVIYFHPNDRDVPNTNIVDEQLHILIQRVRDFFESQVGKSFEFEKYANGKAKVHYFPGEGNSDSYREGAKLKGTKIRDEIDNSENDLGREMSSYLYLIAADLVSLDSTPAALTCGQANYLAEANWWEFWRQSAGPWAVIDISPDCFDHIEQQDLGEKEWEWRVWITAHELGHSFGLLHDFRDSTYVMSYGSFVNGKFSVPDKLSPCAVKWLEASRFFNNTVVIDLDRETEIISGPDLTYSQDTNNFLLRFLITDADGLHQVQLMGPTTNEDPQSGNKLYDCKSLSSRSETVEFIYLKSTENSLDSTKILLRVIDLRGNITEEEFTVDLDEIVPKNVSETAGQIANQTQQTSDSSLSSDANDLSQDARLRATLKGHTDFVSSVAFSPDGRTLASGSWDTTIRLWNPRTAEHSTTLTEHVDRVTSVAFSFNGNMLASGSWDKTIAFWNPHTGKYIRSTYSKYITNETFTSVVTADSDGDSYWFASGSLDDNVWLWKGYGLTKYTNWYKLSGHTHDVSSVAFSADERTLASGSHDNTIKLWYVYTQELRATLKGHTDFVTSIAFSPNGRTLASGSWDSTIILWDVATGKSINIIRGHTDRVLAVAFSPDGRTLASGSDDQTIRLWDVATERQRDTLLGHTSGVAAVAFSPDRRTLASAGGWDNTLRLWDLSPAPTPAPIVRITPSPVVSPATGDNLVIKVNISGVQNVAGYQATVRFDPTALRYVESANGTYLPAGALFVPPVVNANQVTLAATSLDGDSDGAGTLATLTFEVVAVKPSYVGLSDVMVMRQDLTSIPIIVQGGDVVVQSDEVLDVNGDGEVNIQDLTLVATHFGKVGETQADVNGDSVVDIRDLLLVAGGLNAQAVAPSAYSLAISGLTAEEIQKWLSQARRLDLNNATFQKGVAVLQQLMAALTPEETALLPNYPNPFNPETWLPYRLADDADVTLAIYDAKGALVHQMDLGYQVAGFYTDQGRAAYWDGRNRSGEPVSSGVYFYTLAAGDYLQMRRLVIVK